MLYSNSDGGVGLNSYILFQVALIVLVAIVMFFDRNVRYEKLYTDISVFYLLLLYGWGIISSFWSAIPLLTFFFAFQNIVLITLLFFFYSHILDKVSLERVYIFFSLFILMLKVIQHPISNLFTGFHDLEIGGTSAMLFCYCFPEYTKCKDKKRRKFLFYILLISIILVIGSTSSSSNISVLFGLIIFVIFTDNYLYKLLAICGILLLLTLVNYNDLISSLFPGKTEQTLYNANGRTILWESYFDLIKQRPVQGWGFATIERISDHVAMDTHNSFIGILGGLGIIGISFFVLFILTVYWRLLTKLKSFGSLGLLCSISCMLMNSNTYGFLGSKATLLTIVFFQLPILLFMFNKLPYRINQQ